MAEDTTIQWATHTWSPWIGCSRVHTGCTHCYAEAMAGRFGVVWGPRGTRRRTSDAYWRKPLKWEREAQQFEHWDNWQRPRIFPSLCDPFEDWPHVIMDRNSHWPHVIRDRNGRRLATMDDLRRDLFALIDRTPHLDWLLLTKRPENIKAMWPGGRRDNVQLIHSASDQATLEVGLPYLLRCRDLVPVLGLSLEPLLGPVDLRGAAVDWVIVGGESGPNARPCNIAWIRSIARQCRAAEVPCFVKQLGTNYHDEVNGVCGHGTRWPYDIWPAGPSYRLRDVKGGDPAEWPEDLRVREFPNHKE